MTIETPGVVLLVDDEQDLRETASEYLRDQGLTVIEAGSATEAMERAADAGCPISVLVTDFFMPGMNGNELAMHLAGDFPQMQTLYITGYGQNAVVSTDLEADAAQWLSKPLSLRVLEAEVRKMLVRARHPRSH